jgi:hypothetical protein
MNQYRAFTGPFAKVFLGGVFVYQVLYWTWLKLEMDETKVAKNGEIQLHMTPIIMIVINISSRTSDGAREGG